MASASGHSTALPSCNRVLQKKWEEKRFRQHKDRLRSMKSSIDTQTPREFVHIKQNVRKQKITEDRQATVDRHNCELLSRMHHIMHTTGRVEHRNLDWKPKRSLNFIKRQLESDRIQRENQAILMRLQTTRPQYKVKEWESDFKVHQSRARSLQVLPPIETSPPKLQTEIRMECSPERIRLPPIKEDGKIGPKIEPSEVQEDIDVED